MKKILLFLLALCLYTNTYGQISMIANEKIAQSFKDTETIFVLSDIYGANTYEKILKDTWTVTPYKIVKLSDFKLIDYLNGKYSFAMLEVTKIDGAHTTFYLHYLNFFMFENEKKKKELVKFNKIAPKKQSEYNIMKEYRLKVGSIQLYPRERLSEDLLFNSMYNDDAFYNYNRGFLKNYFQKMNSLIIKMVPYGQNGSDCLPELKKLKKETLYIPDYVIKDCGSPKIDENSESQVKEFFSEYKYKYEIIGEGELEEKIISGEEFYYLRYVRVENDKVLQIINSKTGEIVYRCHQSIAHYIKPHYIKDIKESIDTGKV